MRLSSKINIFTLEESGQYMRLSIVTDKVVSCSLNGSSVRLLRFHFCIPIIRDILIKLGIPWAIKNHAPSSTESPHLRLPPLCLKFRIAPWMILWAVLDPLLGL